MNPESLRLFVAIPLPEAVRREISRAQDELKRLAPPGAIRWTEPEQFHLTLKFLGDVPADGVDGLRRSLQPVCAGHPLLAMRACGVGFFPNARSPRVIWAGINAVGGGLLELQAKIEAATREFSATPSTNPFSGHATLGRFKNYPRHKMEPLLGRIEAMGGCVWGEWTAREVELRQSELSPAGAHHTTLAAFALGVE